MNNKKTNGFINVILISMIPLVMILALGFFFTSSLLKIKSLPKNICRTELLRTQHQVSQPLTRLLGLNPLALKLRHELTLSNIKLAQAIVTMNLPLIAYHTKEKTRIELEQIKLDNKQRKLIWLANEKLVSGSIQTRQKLSETLNKIRTDLSYWLDISANQNSKTTTLAVEPDRPGIAPIYLPKENFLIEQSIQQMWQIQLKGKPFINNFISSNFKITDSCQASLEEKSGVWTERLIADSRLQSF